jgi:uncharacterized membrane protein
MQGLGGSASMVWIVMLVLVIVALALGRGWRRPRGGRDARERLDRRYANGEIGRDDYLQMKRDLEQHPDDV